MKKTTHLVFIFLLLGLSILATRCSPSKVHHAKLLHENIDFRFENCCLATSIEGFGSIDVYTNKILVDIKSGSIKINPEFSNPTYTVGYIYLSLGKYIDKESGSWTTSNFGTKVQLNRKISSLNDSIDLAGLKFEIPYTDKKELKDSWIAITTSNGDGPGTNYSHSINK